MNIELLSPAKNLEVGKAAIAAGADAVYIGASRFGARSAAGNSVQDIRELAGFAHQFNARVFVTVNTLLYEDELAEAEKLCHELYGAGADALIIQDPALLKLNLPPVALHASTQMHNNTPERVKFLETVGLQRVVLARELTLDEISEIRANTTVELEAFIHGSLCVSYSGRCYLSEVIGGRSANRGECAQPCRNCYTLTDKDGNVLVKDKHLLSLKDLNLSARIGPLMDAGVSSFKIEGRLKDIDYVKNVTAYYRQLIDKELAKRPRLKRASSGTTETTFVPDPARSFNRGFTEYFIAGRDKRITNPSSPKSEGKILGTVISVAVNKVKIRIQEDSGNEPGTTHPFSVSEQSSAQPLSELVANGDGLCWYDSAGTLQGARVNLVKDDSLLLNDVTGLKPGMQLMRNYDKLFAEMLSRQDSAKRTINISLTFKETETGFSLSGTDEDGLVSEVSTEMEKIAARTPDNDYRKLKEQLQKSGNTIFTVKDVRIDVAGDWFLQSSVINSLRRDLLEKARNERMSMAVDRLWQPVRSNYTMKWPLFVPDALTEKENITNSLAGEFYENAGVSNPSDLRMQTSRGKQPVTGALMTTKMCLKYELGKCPVHQENDPLFSRNLYLSSKDIRFRLSFDCKACVMRLYMADNKPPTYD